MTAAKKTAKLNPTIVKQRREAIEKRIVKLEGKLNKDRALLLRYTTAATTTENAEQEAEAVTSE
jgi:hypothetical protein